MNKNLKIIKIYLIVICVCLCGCRTQLNSPVELLSKPKLNSNMQFISDVLIANIIPNKGLYSGL